MKNLLPPNWNQMDAHARRQYLSANADVINADVSLSIRIEPEERRELKNQLAEESIELSVLKDQYDRVKKEWTEKMKPVKQSVSEKIEKLKSGFHHTTGTTYEIRDHEGNMVYVVLQDGTVYDSRPMFEHERQSTIHNINAKSS